MLKEPLNNLSERGVDYCIDSEKSYYNSKDIIVGVIHSFFAPILLGYFFGVNYGWTYLLSMTILYLTVFRKRPTKNTFFVILFIYCCFAIMIFPFVYHT